MIRPRRGRSHLGLTPAGVVVLALAAMGWVLARAAASPTACLVVYGVLLVALLAWLLELRPLAVDARRSAVEPRVRIGQPVEVEVELRARHRLGNVVLEDRVPDELGVQVREAVAELAAGRAVRYRYHLLPLRRGVYRVGPLTLTRRDPFGLVRRRVSLAAPATVIVHPAVERVTDRVTSRAWQDPPVRPPMSRPSATGFDFAGVRDYVPGDDPRRIVWRATARAAPGDAEGPRYLVRELEQGITDRTRLLLDADRSRHSPGRPSDTFETAVTVVASLGVSHLEAGFSVTVETGTGLRLRELRGNRNRIRLLDALATADMGRASLAELITRLTVDGTGGNVHTVVVTPYVDTQAAARLRSLVRGGTPLILVLVALPEAEPEAVNRATAIGCPVVEVRPHEPLSAAFRTVAVSARR